MKKWIMFALSCLVAVLTITGCGNSTATSGQDTKSAGDQKTAGSPVVIKLATQVANETQLGRTVNKFKEEVESKSNGQIKVEVYPSGQLYGEKDVPEVLTNGTLQMGLSSTTIWSTIVPSTEIFDVPFLFSSYDQAHKAIDGEIGKTLATEMEKVGVKPLIWPDYGFINFTNNTMLAKKPEDFKGMQVRVIGEMTAKMVEGLGATSVFMGGNEVYMALQRGTVNGALSGLSSFADRKYYEVQKYLTVNNAGLIQFVVGMNLEFFNSLSPEQQQIVLDASKAATEFSRKAVVEDDKKALDTLKSRMEVYEVTDFAPWKEATKATKDLYLEKSGDAGKKLLEIAESIK